MEFPILKGKYINFFGNANLLKQTITSIVLTKISLPETSIDITSWVFRYSLRNYHLNTRASFWMIFFSEEELCYSFLDSKHGWRNTQNFWLLTFIRFIFHSVSGKGYYALDKSSKILKLRIKMWYRLQNYLGNIVSKIPNSLIKFLWFLEFRITMKKFCQK